MLKEQFEKALISIQSDCSLPISGLTSNPVSESSASTLTKTNFLVAYSGGMDSHVLLHLCANLKINVRAVYVHHGLQQEADDWGKHCKSVCEDLQIDFEIIRVNAKPSKRQSPEEAARKARYEALKKNIEDQEFLLTAHHRDDQAETFILQLMRGAGTAGLASMPKIQTFGNGFHSRPLLEMSRDDIKQYALAEQLSWIEDTSNTDTSIDRNYIRHEVLPLLKNRWAQANLSIMQSAEQQQDNLELIEAMAAIDFANIVTSQINTLSVNKLLKLSNARQLNVLRYWINQSGKNRSTQKCLQQIITTMLDAAADAEPLVSWSDIEVRRYKDELFIMSKLKQEGLDKTFQWDAKDSLYIDDVGVSLNINEECETGLSKTCLDKKIEIRFRQGGEKIKPHGYSHTVSLKKLMQQNDIPPWERSRIPLLYIDDELACVCDYWMATEFVTSEKDCWLPVMDVNT